MSRPTRSWPAAGCTSSEVTPDRAVAEAAPGRRRARTSSSSPRRTPRRPSAPGQQSALEVQVNEVDPVAVNYAGFLAAGMSSAINARDHRARRGRGPGLRRGRRRPERGGHPARGHRRPDAVRGGQPRPVAAGRPGLLRTGRPGAHPAAPGRDPRRPVARPRADDRRHRAVPDRPGQHQRGPGRQGPGLRAARRRHRGPHDGPARRRVRRARCSARTAAIVLAIALLLVASLGLGLFIAVVSDSERQAVQLSLLVLLASVFFSGFVLPIDEFTEPVRALAYMLPVTHGIRAAPGPDAARLHDRGLGVRGARRHRGGDPPRGLGAAAPEHDPRLGRAGGTALQRPVESPSCRRAGRAQDAVDGADRAPARPEVP